MVPPAHPLANTLPARAAALICCLGALIVGGSRTTAAVTAEELPDPAVRLLERFCFDCHTGEQAEAHTQLDRLAAEPDFTEHFRTWRKVAEMLEERKMPPEDAAQPSDAQRRELLSVVRDALKQTVRQHAGDPGAVVLRRLTSAEYAYTIHDLTGLDLKLEQDFVSDAVGGEGFTNTGVAQFVQDSTLERYLAAAKQVAEHAVVGAGPLRFYQDAGKTGFELSAITRIQEIYRQHGFRTAAGEGGEAYGLDLYPRAFYCAWRYKHRKLLGLGGKTLAALAEEEGLDVRFVEYIWSLLNELSPSFPTSEIVEGWRELPAPKGNNGRIAADVRQRCNDLARILQAWQSSLGQNADDKEEAVVLAADAFDVDKSKSFLLLVQWDEDAVDPQASVHLFVEAVHPQGRKPTVIWRDPRIQFRWEKRRDKPPQPLRKVVTAEDVERLAFGKHPLGGNVDKNDFVTVGTATRAFELPIPEGARLARFTVDAVLDLEHGDECIVRCGLSETADPVQGSTVLGLLANPQGETFKEWVPGVIEFAQLLPQTSHREPAPSDRDRIPPPFDNTYNNPERNLYHYRIKYHRDDRFLVENILNDATRKQLDQAWLDLFGSFDYHAEFLNFVAGKYQLDLDGKSIADLDADDVDALPAEPRRYVQELRHSYDAVQSAFAAARPGHVEDAIQLAARAWRRPLSSAEQDRLRSFYDELTTRAELDHPQAIRALLARILTSPDFLYRAERPTETAGVVPLSNWELANRLSYFLWSSLPDDELRRAAAAGELGSTDELVRQARRMLRDPKARRLATEFFGQWFGFYQFDRHRGIDPKRFPEFTDGLKAAMYDEAVTFFEHIVREDRPVDEILFADYGFGNRELAEHYGFDRELPDGDTLQRVKFANSEHRGGLMGLGAVLTVTSAPLRTSPVKRGDWILRRVLGTPVPPPPADAGSIPADDVQSDGLTLRQRLEAHRSEASCRNCHSRIDPLGFALENYDALGRWREKYRDGKAIDTSGTLRDGTEISGPEGLRKHMKDQQDLFHRTLCTKLLGYALGRRESIGDALLLEQMLADLRQEGRFSQLVERIVTSRQFRYRRSSDGDAGQRAELSNEDRNR